MAGFQVFRADGKLQFDASLPTYSFIGKGSKATQARFGSNSAPSSLLIPADEHHMVALRAPFFTGRAGMNGANQVFHTEGAVGSMVDYWIFAATPTIQTASPSGGLQLFDAQGRLTYSSDLKVMRVGGLISYGGGAADTAQLPAGRTYATVYPSFSGHGFELGDVWFNGVPVEVGSEPGYGSYSQSVSGKIYGTRWVGSTCYAGEVSFDDLSGAQNQGTMGFEPAPSREFWRNNMVNALLVDVTHL